MQIHIQCIEEHQLILGHSHVTYVTVRRDNQKDIAEGKLPRNLGFKKYKWKVILNISNTISKKKKESKE